MTRGKLLGIAGCLLVCIAVLASSAVASTPEPVTIKADEVFGADGTTEIKLEATGGIFGTAPDPVVGTGESLQETQGGGNSGSHRVPLVIHGVDVYTFGDSAITFKWQFRCVYSSDIDAVCSGPWHITSGTGDYEGAQGGGTAIDLCQDQYAGDTYIATTCKDTLTGKIQSP